MAVTLIMSEESLKKKMHVFKWIHVTQRGLWIVGFEIWTKVIDMGSHLWSPQSCNKQEAISISAHLVALGLKNVCSVEAL